MKVTLVKEKISLENGLESEPIKEEEMDVIPEAGDMIAPFINNHSLWTVRSRAFIKEKDGSYRCILVVEPAIVSKWLSSKK